MTVMEPVLTVNRNETATLTITAMPAELAAGKQLTITDPEGILLPESDAVFDENGIAMVTCYLLRTGMTKIKLGITGEAVTSEMTVISISDEVLPELAFNEKTEPEHPDAKAELGDLNGDDIINASDAAMILIAAAAIGAGQDPGLTEEQGSIADVNGDDTINASDAVIVLIYGAAIGAGQDVKLTDYINK